MAYAYTLSATHFDILQASHCVCQLSRNIMAVQFNEVKTLWDGLLVVYGLKELAHLVEFEYENVRECFLKCRNCWCQDVIKYTLTMEIAQIVTILSNLTFNCQMSGESYPSEFNSHVEANDIAGPFVLQSPRSALRERLRLVDKKVKTDLLTVELDKAQRDVAFLVGYTENLEGLHTRFAGAVKLLSELQEFVKAQVDARD